MSVEETFRRLKTRFGDLIPEPELRAKAEMAHEINRLKQEKNALILGHNYMESVLFFSICDHTGDSLELSRKAAETDKDIIVFCGVEFMAETAKILSPDKTVLIPAKGAGCSLAEGISAEDVRRLKERFPGVPVVTYVNTYADVKAECDLCCTSGNAAAVVRSLEEEAVIFLPDQYLARNVAKETGKRIIFPEALHSDDGTPRPATSNQQPATSNQQMIGWNARCEVHERFTTEQIAGIRERFPGTMILAHPECPPHVCEAADFAGSTSAMIRFVEETSAPRFLLLTECAMADNIAAANPEKKILRECGIRCPHMEKITLENTLEALRENRHVIEVPEDIRVRAARSVERMLAIG